MIPEYLLAIVGFLLLVTNVFWGFVCHKLLDKLMSRNYTEYVQTEALKKDIKKSPKEFKVDIDDEESQRQARELNSLMNMV